MLKIIARSLHSEPGTMLIAFLKDKSGATAIEYSLIAAGISIVIVVAVGTLGQTVLGLFNDVNTKLGG